MTGAGPLPEYTAPPPASGLSVRAFEANVELAFVNPITLRVWRDLAVGRGDWGDVDAVTKELVRRAGGEVEG